MIATGILIYCLRLNLVRCYRQDQRNQMIRKYLVKLEIKKRYRDVLLGCVNNL